LPIYLSEPLFRSRLSMVILIKTHILLGIRHNMLAFTIILPATILAVSQQAIPVISSSDDAYTSCESCPLWRYVPPQTPEHRLSWSASAADHRFVTLIAQLQCTCLYDDMV
jgi:hypothetical protein